MVNVFISIIISSTFLFSQNYIYSGIDVNPNSSTLNENVGPSYFVNNITITYFGHQN